MVASPILVAGIGNIFLGDDGFGVEVVRRLSGTPWPPEVTVADYGIRGIHLAHELAHGRFGTAILVDAAPRGGTVGSLYVIEPDVSPSTDDSGLTDAHGLTPDAVLRWVHRIGGTRTRILLVGCEPGSTEPAMELTPAVAASVDTAVEIVGALIETALGVAPCA
jgi:hydrogenase maturation protease